MNCILYRAGVQHLVLIYQAGAQDAPQEMERNKAAAKQSQFRPTTQLLLTFPPFPVGHPAHQPGRSVPNADKGVQKFQHYTDVIYGWSLTGEKS